MTALHLLEGLRQDGVRFAIEGAEVIVLTLPAGLVLRGCIVPGRPWALGLFDLVAQHDDYTRMLRDCAQLSWAAAEALSWRLVVAGYAGPGA